MFSTSDPILAPSRATLEQGLEFIDRNRPQRHGDAIEYVSALFLLCQDVGVDFAIALAQWSHETAYGQSRWWNERLNPAGMGVTGDPAQNEASPVFATGAEAARAQVAHLLLYATGEIDRGCLTPLDDPRYAAYIKAYGRKARATTVGELASRPGRNSWAADPEYATGIGRHFAEILAGTPPVAPVQDDDHPQPALQTPTYPGAVLPADSEGMAWNGEHDLLTETGTLFHADRRIVTVAVSSLRIRMWADTSAETVGDSIPNGESVEVLGWVRGEAVSGEDRWWVTTDGARMWAGGTREVPR